MRKPALLLSALTVTGAAVAFQDAVTATGSSWSDPKFGTLTLDGVCDVSPEKVGCWDMEGKDSPQVTARAEKFFRETSSLSFVVGKKNRYVATSWRAADSVGMTPPTVNGQDTRTHYGVDPSLNDPKTINSVTLFPVDSKSGSFDATFEVHAQNKLGAFSLLPKVGEVSESEGKSVKVVRIEKVAPERYATFALQNSRAKQGWRIYVELKNVAMNMLSLDGNLKDRDGKQLKFVDEDGNPDPNYKLGSGVPPPFGRLFFSMDFKSKEQWFETNVNPERLGKFNFTPFTSTSRKVRFTSIAADPKPTGGNLR